MSRLDKDIIPQPELWKMDLTIGHDGLTVVLTPPVATESMVWSFIPFDPAQPLLKSVETAVYDNPLLLSDFKAVRCIFATEDFTLIPTDVEPERRQALVDTLAPDAAATAFEIPVAQNVVMVVAPPADVKAFLQRTFFNATFTHRLALLARYVRRCISLPIGKSMCAIASPSRTDVVAYDGDDLTLLNSFEGRSAADSAYYVMLCRQQLDFAPGNPLTVAGTAAGEMMNILHDYLSEMRAMLYPISGFRTSASSAEMPVDVLITAICE